MEKVLVFSLLVVASLRSASTEEKFFKEGGSVKLVLRPTLSVPITIIQWKYKDSILAEWVENVLPLTHNREHIKLDKVSGRLAMEKMTKAEEGVYSVEVNNNVQKETYNVVFITDVPKPKIWISPLTCSEESDQCTLKCDGDTTGAEPVTYSWKTDNGVWKESSRDMPITKKQHGQVKTFTCKMKNPVGEKESDLFTNKLCKKEEPKPSPVGWIVGVIVVALLVAVGGVIWAWKKKKLPCGKRITDPESPAKNENVLASSDGANVELLKGNSTTNTSPGATPGSQEGPAGGADSSNPPPEEAPPEASGDKEPGSEDALTGEPADPPNTPREDNTTTEDAAAAGEADAEACVKL
ncbi:uncharacterized protein [Pseudochaenichthys georgianus]|uniref:uncharacterized protein n=1 Tax=Pseudochaenichthys georgianus TaxID=52239 RepID=UPI00146DD2DA|nr:uncharacterized protein LOC117459672 [Pseudochaenichthys georgianus]